jgi:hypothetical protein
MSDRLPEYVHPRLIQVTELSSLFGMSVRSVRRKLRENSFPLKPLGWAKPRLLWKRAEVERYFAGETPEPQEEDD